MKKFILAITAFLALTVQASAMGYEQARQQALFLTDKMAYELNLTEQQYEAAYEINLDYLLSIDSRDDVYGVTWTQRNTDFSYVLFDWQYSAFCAASYFFRPIYWDAGYWHFGVYARYPHRTYLYFGRPTFWVVYRGGHSWRHNGGRSWYRGRDYGHHRPHHAHHGMRDGYSRGHYHNGWHTGTTNHGSARGGRGGNNGYSNDNRGHGSWQGGSGKDNQNYGHNRGGNGRGNRGDASDLYNRGGGDRGYTSQGRGNRESSTRQTVTFGSQGSNRMIGNRSTGSFSNFSRSATQAPTRSFTPSGSSSSGRSMRSSGFSSSPSRSSSFGGGFGSSRGGSFGGGGSRSGGSHGGSFGGRR